MRFTTLSVIDIVSLVTSTGIGIAMASYGFGYWALVASTVLAPLTYTICVWIAAAWIPGLPHRNVGVRSMMKFGGTITANGLIMYISSNFEKVLLGRFWGVDAVGIYGRAYQLINIPTDNLNTAAGGVAFAALSRVKEDPERLKSYFLKGYTLILSLTIPVTLSCALFADDMILVCLGPKWHEAAAVFRLLAPTTLAFAILNPLGWLLNSLGLVERGLKIAMVLGPLMIFGYMIGLPYGPKGVALAYSSVMMFAVLPLIAWVVRGTVITVRSILIAIAKPLLAGATASITSLVFHPFYRGVLSPLPRLATGITIVVGVYLLVLFYILRQKSFYLNLFRGLKRRDGVEENIMASV
jgi:O-antigen/teichoic acid export membrane protein